MTLTPVARRRLIVGVAIVLVSLFLLALRESQRAAIDEWCAAHGGHVEAPEQIGRVCVVERG